MLARVAQDDAVIPVRALVDMIPLLGGATGSNIPSRASTAIIERMRCIDSAKVLIKDPLNNPRLHPQKPPALILPCIHEAIARLVSRRTQQPSSARIPSCESLFESFSSTGCLHAIETPQLGSHVSPIAFAFTHNIFHSHKRLHLFCILCPTVNCMESFRITPLWLCGTDSCISLLKC